MSAYLMARIEVTNWEQYQNYVAAATQAVAKFSGRFIARGGETLTLEGPEETRRVAIVEFPSLDKIKEFYNSSEYQEAKRLREGAAIVSLVAVGGV